jgi:hypothetical protein
MTTTFAVDPIGEIFPPKPTPNTRAHQRRFVPGTHWSSKYPIIGTIAIVIGILSIIAEAIAVTQSTIRAVRSMFDSTQLVMRLARYPSTPAASRPQTRTNKEVKNINIEKCILLRYFCGLS